MGNLDTFPYENDNYPNRGASRATAVCSDGTWIAVVPQAASGSGNQHTHMWIGWSDDEGETWNEIFSASVSSQHYNLYTVCVDSADTIHVFHNDAALNAAVNIRHRSWDRSGFSWSSDINAIVANYASRLIYCLDADVTDDDVIALMWGDVASGSSSFRWQFKTTGGSWGGVHTRTSSL